MVLERLDREMNALMEKYDLDETTELEEFFLKNIAEDIVQLLVERGDKEAVDKIIKIATKN